MLASKIFKDKWTFDDIDIKGITIDSRKVKEGYIFIAVKGQNEDGHKYAKKAEEMGAGVIVCEDDVDVKIPQIKYPDTKIAMAALAAEFYERPEQKLKVIGITGTNGKTTTSYLVKSILETAGKKVGIVGTNEIMVGNEDVGIKSTTPTTPNAIELRQIFAKMLQMGAEYAVMEVSSHGLDLHRVDGIEYISGGFTNLTQDHLDYHKTMENYFEAKKKLFDISKTGVVNIDDEYGRRIAEEYKVLTYGTQNADLTAENIEIKADGVSFDLVYEGKTYDAFLGISGKFSVYNALCAIGLSIGAGIDVETAVSALKNACGVKGRLETVPTDTPYSVIIDYAHTPDGLENVLNAVNEYKKGRLILVFGCGGDRDRTKRPIMGEIGHRLSDICIVTSDNPRTENPDAIIDDICHGICGSYKRITDRKEAIGYALSIARKDDIILLAGKGQETYQIIGTQKCHFDEREIVKELLK